MAKSDISAQPLNLDQLFSDNYAFSVPIYQRPYAWSQEQAGELLEDLLTHMGTETQSLAAVKPYFLGTIVLIKGKRPDAAIVDGQQRLTTLTILLAVLRKLLPADHGAVLARHIYRRQGIRRRHQFRLDLCEKDRDFFSKYIQQDDGLKNLSGVDVTELPESQQRIAEVARYFDAQLDSHSDSERQRLAQFVLHNCQLVTVSTPDHDSSFTIFTVLNKRGLQLTVVDLLKADILGAISPTGKVSTEEVEEYQQKWEELEQVLGRDGFESLIGHARTIYLKGQPQTSLAKDFKKWVMGARGGLDAMQVIDDILVPLGHALSTVQNHNYYCTGGAEITKSVKTINSLLEWLTRLASTDWVPPAIEYLSRHRNEPEMLSRFFADLERLAVYMMMAGFDPVSRLKRYRKFLDDMRSGSGSDCLRSDSPLQLTRDEAADMYRRLDGDIYVRAKNVRQYILLRLDDVLARGKVVYRVDKLSVEHVLPQNPDATWLSAWNNCWADAKTRKRWVNRLANLVLLEPGTNLRAANLSFERKKIEYVHGPEGHTPFVLTNNAMQARDWSTETVAARQKGLLTVLADLWRLKVVDDTSRRLAQAPALPRSR